VGAVLYGSGWGSAMISLVPYFSFAAIHGARDGNGTDVLATKRRTLFTVHAFSKLVRHPSS
jgi:hypothetical protein